MTAIASRGAKVMAVLIAAGLTVGGAAACKGKTAEGPPQAPVVETYNLESLGPVLGLARDDVSGVTEVSGDASEVVIFYRYYDADMKNYDDDLVKELAPKIEALYRRFPRLDRARFQITTNNPDAPGEWKPMLDFALDRKTVEKVAWSGILADDFFKSVIELKRRD